MMAETSGATSLAGMTFTLDTPMAPLAPRFAVNVQLRRPRLFAISKNRLVMGLQAGRGINVTDGFRPCADGWPR